MSTRVGRYRIRVHRWSPDEGGRAVWRNVVGGRVVLGIDVRYARRRYRELRKAGDSPDAVRGWLIRSFCVGEDD